MTVDRKDAILDLGETYTAFSADPVDAGSVKFMYTTDSIYVPKVELPEEDPSVPEETQKPEAAEEPHATAADVLSRLEDFFRGLFGGRAE